MASIADYARLGFTPQQAQTLANSGGVYKPGSPSASAFVSAFSPGALGAPAPNYFLGGRPPAPAGPSTPEDLGLTRVVREPSIAQAVRDILAGSTATTSPGSALVGIGGIGRAGTRTGTSGGIVPHGTIADGADRTYRSPLLANQTNAAVPRFEQDVTDIRQSLADFVKEAFSLRPQARELAQNDISALTRLTGGADTPGSLANLLAANEQSTRLAESRNDTLARLVAAGQANAGRLGQGGSNSNLDAALAEALTRVNLQREMERAGRGRSNALATTQFQAGATGLTGRILQDYLAGFAQPIGVQQASSAAELARLAQLGNIDLANTIVRTPEELMSQRLANLAGGAGILGGITEYTRPFQPAYLPSPGGRLPGSDLDSLISALNSGRGGGFAGTGGTGSSGGAVDRFGNPLVVGNLGATLNSYYPRNAAGQTITQPLPESALYPYGAQYSSGYIAGAPPVTPPMGQQTYSEADLRALAGIV